MNQNIDVKNAKRCVRLPNFRGGDLSSQRVRAVVAAQWEQTWTNTERRLTTFQSMKMSRHPLMAKSSFYLTLAVLLEPGRSVALQ